MISERRRSVAEVGAAQERFLEAALLAERSGAADVAASLLADGVEPWTLITDLLVPVQRAIGERWAAATCSVGQEHAVTAVSDAVLSSLTVGFEPAPTRGHVIVVCAEGELHSLPSRMASELLMLDGYRVTYLGAPLSASHLARVLADLDADFVAVSCTMASNLLGAVRSVAVARDAGFDVAVGGRAVDGMPSRSVRVGATLEVRLGSGTVPLPEIAPHDRGDLAAWELLERAAASMAGQVFDELVAWRMVSDDPVTRAELMSTIEDAVRVVAAAGFLDEVGLAVDHARWMQDVLGAHGHPATLVPLAWTRLEQVSRWAGPATTRLMQAALQAVSGSV